MCLTFLCCSHQCDPPVMHPSVGLRQRVQPPLWMHLLPHLRVSGDFPPNQNQSRLRLISAVCSFQGAQQNPRFEFLPDRPGGPPAPLRRRLLLSFQHGQLLQQLDQDCQIPQRSLRPRNLPPRLMPADGFSQDFILFINTIHVLRSNPIYVDFNHQTQKRLTSIHC